jgi:hypothetical protein
MVSTCRAGSGRAAGSGTAAVFGNVAVFGKVAVAGRVAGVGGSDRAPGAAGGRCRARPGIELSSIRVRTRLRRISVIVRLPAPAANSLSPSAPKANHYPGDVQFYVAEATTVECRCRNLSSAHRFSPTTVSLGFLSDFPAHDRLNFKGTGVSRSWDTPLSRMFG